MKRQEREAEAVRMAGDCQSLVVVLESIADSMMEDAKAAGEMSDEELDYLRRNVSGFLAELSALVSVP